MYFGGLEAFGQAYDPVIKSCARAQLEGTGFLTRRAQACLEAPQRLAQCRTPQDIANEQMRFWRAAFSDYAESTRRMAEAVAACAMPTLQFVVPSDEAGAAHDYITFPESEEPTETGRGRSGSRERKAA
jgi:hypothetical protein